MPTVDEVIRAQTGPDPSRFAVGPDCRTMMAVVTTGMGGPEVLEYREVPVPRPAEGELLLEVLAAGVNPTDVNARVGWYAGDVSAGTDEAARGGRAAGGPEGGWNGPSPFPLIQGADCCGRVAGIGPGGDGSLLGRRALIRPCMRPHGFGSPETVWMGSDFDGAFAQFVRAPASEVFVVDSDWSDAELASMPCAYGTAENMLRRAGVTEGERVLITGASGGVGSALVQLACRRGAVVTAVTRAEAAETVTALGATHTCPREAVTSLDARSFDVVADNVAGPGFADVLRTLRRAGRYVSSGAIAGPLVAFDKRVFYLNDLTLLGCTAWDEPVFADVVAAIERRQVVPLVARTYPLAATAEAQRDLLRGDHTGKLVVVPPKTD